MQQAVLDPYRAHGILAAQYTGLIIGWELVFLDFPVGEGAGEISFGSSVGEGSEVVGECVGKVLVSCREDVTAFANRGGEGDDGQGA